MLGSFIVRRSLFLLSLLIILVGVTPLAAAIDYNGIGGLPANPDPNNSRTKSIFIYDLGLGNTKNDGLSVVNNSSAAKTVELYATDSEISSGGSFACKQKVDSRSDIGAWITFAKNEVTLGPGAKEIVPFTISIPTKADVGEHDGCVVIQEKKSEPDIKQNGVNISLRSALRVVVTVPGNITKDLDIENLQIVSKDYKKIITTNVGNKGNVSLDANVQVTVKNLIGQTTYKNGGVYPIISRTRPLELNYEMNNSFWGGVYKVRASVEYNNDPKVKLGEKQDYNISKNTNVKYVFVMPRLGALLVYVLMLSAIAAGALYYLKRKKNKTQLRATWVEYTTKKKDTINSLAVERDTSWKTIAKFNKLKPPYHLEPKSVILLPPVTKTEPPTKKTNTVSKTKKSPKKDQKDKKTESDKNAQPKNKDN